MPFISAARLRALVPDLRPAVSMRALLGLLDPLAAAAALLVLGASDLRLPLLAAAVTVVAASAAHVHRSRLVLSVLDDTPRLVLLTGTVLAGVIILGPYVVPSAPGLLEERLAAAAALMLLALVLVRVVVYGTTQRMRRRGRVAHAAIVVGTDLVATRLTEALVRHPEHGLRPVGMISIDDAEVPRLPVTHLGGLGSLPRAMVDLGVSHVVFAFAAAPGDDLVRAVRRAVEDDHQVFVVPRFFETVNRTHFARTEIVHDIALTRLSRISEWSLARVAKRLIDVSLAGLALLLLAPLMAVLAVLARLETGGALFRQTRVGRLGRTFTLYKFQTLKPAAPSDEAVWNIDNDARLGTVGRFLRRSGLDELPQLVNVLRGDMSLVGPRPERPHYVSEFAQRHAAYADRHRMRAGITGWAQVHDLRGDTSISERVRFDNNYIDGWSLWRDITILARTLPTLARPQPQGKDVLAVVAAGVRSGARAAAAPAPQVRRVEPVPSTSPVAQARQAS